MKKLKPFFKTLGPGILFASTAIGVSHLVQSTRAGALYGFGLLWAIIIANILKYPFFEYGSRYASAAGESLIEGYARMSKYMIWLFAIITFGTMFFVVAAIGAVTAGFLDNLFGLYSIYGEDSYLITIAGLFIICILLLALGQFKILDGLIKIIGSVLLFTTIAAFIISMFNGPTSELTLQSFSPIWDDSPKGFFFLIALMGWMPTAVDLSTWNSIWTLERIKSSGYKPSLKETLNEFRLGYWISAVLAFLFLSLGAYLMYGSGKSMPDKSHLFANEVINLYTQNIGEWSYIIIASAGFSIMFGTCIAVFDGYTRASTHILKSIFSNIQWNTRKISIIILSIVGIGSFSISTMFVANLKSLVDLATSISFVVAPIIAFANFKLVTGKFIPENAKPGKFLRALSWTGLVYLVLFSLAYLWI